MQKIAIIGGTGMTGQCSVRHATQRGLEVRVLYRSDLTVPEDFKTNDKITLVNGDALNLDAVKNLIDGVDGVTVILGTRRSLDSTTDLSDGMKNIITAMNEKGIKKVAVCLSAFLLYEPGKVPSIFIDITADHQRMLNAIKACDLEYRAIFPPRIENKPKGEFTTCHDSSPGTTISKYDLGAFLVDSLEQEEHCRKVIGIATVKD